jgi:UDP-N-acetylglucosamine 2-epimerase
MARGTDAFGDGHASARIVRTLEAHLFGAQRDRAVEARP